MTVMHFEDRAEAFNARAQLSGWKVECDPGLAFERPELIELCRLWYEKAKPHGVPPRSAFDARAVKNNIRNLTIVERVADSGGIWRYRFRLYSSTLARLTGDRTGTYLDEISSERFLAMWVNCYETVLAAPRPLRFINHYEMEPVSFLRGESLCAPMGDDSENPNMILSCTYVSPKAGYSTP